MGQRPALVVFDCDGVLTLNRSSWSLVHRVLGTDNRADLQAFLGDHIDVHEFIRRDVARWQSVAPGLTPARLQDAVSPYMTPMPGAADLIASLRAVGTTVACISGGLDLLVNPLAARLGIDQALTFANGLSIHTDWRLAGGGIVRVSPKAKDLRLRALLEHLQLPPAEVVAIGDTHDDAKMFMQQVRGIAFNSTDERLHAAAHHVEHRADLRHLAPVLGLPRLPMAP